MRAPAREPALAGLAERAGADPEALARMLRHLVAHGVFTEPRPGQFAVNRAPQMTTSPRIDDIYRGSL